MRISLHETTCLGVTRILDRARGERERIGSKMGARLQPHGAVSLLLLIEEAVAELDSLLDPQYVVTAGAFGYRFHW